MAQHRVSTKHKGRWTWEFFFGDGMMMIWCLFWWWYDDMRLGRGERRYRDERTYEFVLSMFFFLDWDNAMLHRMDARYHWCFIHINAPSNREPSLMAPDRSTPLGTSHWPGSNWDRSEWDATLGGSWERYRGQIGGVCGILICGILWDQHVGSKLVLTGHRWIIFPKNISSTFP